MTAPTTVDGYLAALPADQRAALQQLRETITAAAPEADEVISYQVPTYRYEGALVSFGAASRHCALYVVSEVVMEAYRDELAPYSKSKTTIRFTPEKPIPASLVKKLVKARVKENAARREPAGAVR